MEPEPTDEKESLRNGSSFTVVVSKVAEKEYVETTNLAESRGPPTFIKQFVSFSSSNRLKQHLENAFYRLGVLVAKRPFIVLVLSLILAGLGCIGLPQIKEENNAIKLWIPQESDFSLNYAWLWSNHPPDFREHTVILHGDNVLTPPAIQKMYTIYKSVYDIRTKVHNTTWEDSCFRIPVVKITEIISKMQQRRKRSLWDDEEDPFAMDSFENSQEEEVPQDFSVGNYPTPYCDIVNALSTLCLEETILEMWAHEGEFTALSDDEIANVTEEEILEKINDWKFSELYLIEKDFSPMLGGVWYDKDGKIAGAKAVYMRWFGQMNATLALLEGGSGSAGTGEMVDSITDEFETRLSEILLDANNLEPTSIKVEVKVANSFGHIASATIMGDVSNLVLGFSIMFIYVNLNLGKFNLVEQRGFLSLMGLGSVGLAIGFSYGVCAALGLTYGPLHNIIPFLLLGIGIDDMFVTTACFNNLPEQYKSKSIQEKFGETMRNAGCAITVTSVTDFLAFIIGGSTVLPALRSFCIFCAVGLIVVFVFQATWFVAWFSLDQKRVQEKRDGALFCYVHQNYTPNRFSQVSILRQAFTRLSKVILQTPVKIFFLLATTAILCISVWGNISLRQEFNPIWFLPPESFLAQWHEHNAEYFPSQGEQVTIFIGKLDLPEELYKLDNLSRELEAQTDIVASIDSWYTDFNKYLTANIFDDPEKTALDLSEEDYHKRLTQFLYSAMGAKHRFLFTFEKGSELVCGVPAPNLELSVMTFRHVLLDGPSEQIPAMNRIKDLIAAQNFSGRVFPMSQGYASWETDEVISYELYRNLALALACIFITTWILLFNLWASCQVLLCVFLTLVNVGGFMHFWGLTIDTVSCTILIISVGLCVDYSAHIAHAFLHATGSKNKKARNALIDIGPAVLNGGFSTLLAFILLAFSRSHVFTSFFKIFFLVVMFGLYNGLIVLPILLSLVGPGDGEEKSEDSMEMEPEREPFKPIIKETANIANNQTASS